MTAGIHSEQVNATTKRVKRRIRGGKETRQLQAIQRMQKSMRKLADFSEFAVRSDECLQYATITSTL